MKKTPIFLIVFFGLFLNLSCYNEEDTDTEVTGQVVNSVTGLPLKSVKILLIEEEADGGSPHSLTLKSAYTSSDGSFNFSFNARSKQKFKYLIQAEAETVPGVPISYNSSASGEIKKEEQNNIEVKITPPASLIMKLNPPPPYNSNDSITAKFTEAANPSNSFEINERTANGILRADDIIMGEYYVKVNKLKYSIKTELLDTIFLDRQEVETYIVDFH